MNRLLLTIAIIIFVAFSKCTSDKVSSSNHKIDTTSHGDTLFRTCEGYYKKYFNKVMIDSNLLTDSMRYELSFAGGYIDTFIFKEDSFKMYFYKPYFDFPYSHQGLRAEVSYYIIGSYKTIADSIIFYISRFEIVKMDTLIDPSKTFPDTFSIFGNMATIDYGYCNRYATIRNGRINYSEKCTNCGNTTLEGYVNSWSLTDTMLYQYFREYFGKRN
jgi:hypothetical protein